jgi:hypothetical protein
MSSSGNLPANNSSSLSSDPSSNTSSLQQPPSSSSSNTFPTSYNPPSHQNSNDSLLPPLLPLSAQNSASRFNSFALPAYRNPHSASSSAAPQHHSSLTPSAPSPASSTHQNISSTNLPHNPFSNSSVAESSSQHLSHSSTTSYLPHQQQQQPSHLLSTTSTTTSSAFSGSAAKTAGGGGGSGSAGSGVPNLSLGQIHLLIATINDRNYETKRKEILKVGACCLSVPAESVVR